MKISGIYKIQSSIKPERIYIGSAININDRWSAHISALKKNKHHSSKLQNHFNKYGESDLQFSILLGCDKEDLLKIEQYFLDSHKPFFNICIIAGSQLGMKHKKGQIPWNKGKKLSEEIRRNMSKGQMGNKHWLSKHHSKETIEKLRECKKGNKYNLGRKQSVEHKLNISKASLGRQFSEETRKKMSESQLKRKPFTFETKKKMSESHKKYA